MILVDTSAWVEYDRATESPADLRLTDLLMSGTRVAVTEPVIGEVLMGARDDMRLADLRRLLASQRLVRLRPTSDFDSAVAIYRACRRVGITPRGIVDCLVAAVAQRVGATVLAWDRDMANISTVIAVDLETGSLGGP